MKNVLLLMPEQFSCEALPVLSQLIPQYHITPLSIDESMDVIYQALTNTEFLVFSGIEISRDLLFRAPKLRLVQKWGAGIDSIDLRAAKELKIQVANIPGGNAVGVAEHFFALLLSLYKKICLANEAMHSEHWPQPEILRQGIEEASGKTLSIVGLGQIGKAIATRAIAFNMEVLYYKRTRLLPEEEKELKVSFGHLNDIVQQADVLGLTLPLTLETEGLFNLNIFRLMKPSSVLINVSRGRVINEPDLYQALTNGIIAGAGLDVYGTEPPSVQNPILKLNNVIATPHIAGRTKQAMRYITEQCALNIRLITAGKKARFLVS